MSRLLVFQNPPEAFMSDPTSQPSPASQSELLVSVFTAQVLSLAIQLEAHDKARGVTSGGYMQKALKEVTKARPQVVQWLAQTEES
jgi:hypothetical protein